MLTSGRKISSARRERPIAMPIITPAIAASVKPASRRSMVSIAWCGRMPETDRRTKADATSPSGGNSRRGNTPSRATISHAAPTTRNGKAVRATTRHHVSPWMIGAPAGAAETALRTATSSGPAKSAAFEESALRVGIGAAERAVAVRKTPEPANDVGVHLGVFFAFGIAGLAAERDTAFLVGEALRMHQRQMEEAPLRRFKQPVGALRDRLLGNRARLGVARERARVAPEQIARKLIEQDEERQRAVRRRLPVVEPAGCRGLIGRKKPGADLGVEGLFALEPFCRPGRAPEREHLLGARN